jgi:hypothetical protein
MTDAFGLYRIDGLAPGVYRVRVLDEGGRQLAERTVRLLFGQDVQID